MKKTFLILAAILLLASQAHAQATPDSAKISDMASIRSALQNFWNSNKSYPVSLSSIGPYSSYIYIPLPYECSPASKPCTSYHLAANLSSFSVEFSNDSDANTLNLAGSINGSDSGPCRPSDGAGYCLDYFVTGNSSVSSGASGLNQTQIDAIISLLASFGADQSVIDNVRAALGGSSGSIPGKCVDLKIDLKVGMKNDEVYKLQVFLKTKSYLSTSATGYYGNLTSEAVKKFQAANGVSATGNVGPITRAKIKTLSCI